MRILMIWSVLLLGALQAVLIPKPREITPREGHLVVDVQTRVIAPAALGEPAKLITEALTRMSGMMFSSLTLKQAGRMEFPRAIRLEIVPSEVPASYLMEVTPKGLKITGSDQEGLMHGVQTLVQIIRHPGKPMQRMVIPCQTIRDSAAVPRRIFYLDVNAHLYPTYDLKELVDWLAFHKVNEFHLKLNGDYGWRMESEKFPRLHEVGSVRSSTPPYGDPKGSDGKEYGGYYTRGNLTDLAEYARSRQIRLIPAFSFSSGASAILAAYPELGEKPEETKVVWQDWKVGLPVGRAQSDFIQGILEEASTVFPDGIRLLDEDERAGLLAKELSGKKIKVVEGGKTVTDFSVYGLDEKNELLANKNREAVAGLNTLKKVYGLEAEESIEARLETQLVHDFEKLQYQVFPRISAFAEAGWLAGEKESYEEFRTRVEKMLERYRIAGLKPSGIFEVVERAALHGTKVTTTMSALEDRWPELAFDGDAQTSFRANSAKEGEVLVFEFPYTIEGPVVIATGGENGDAPSIAEDAVVETSVDGLKWTDTRPFDEGAVVIEARKGTKYLRLRMTGDQDHALILHEVELAESLLVPDLVEVRELRIPKVDRDKIEVDIRKLVFEVNFEKSPELREEITVMRRAYFLNWHRIAEQLGVIEDPRTKLRFKLDISKLGEMSDADARDELLKQLLAHLQHFRPDSPEWFVSGIQAMLRYQIAPNSTWAGSFPGKGDPDQALAGGRETAAFFLWVSKKYTGAVLQGISQDCSGGGYREELWEQYTRKSFQEVLDEYRRDQ